MNIALGIGIVAVVVSIGLYPVWMAKQRRNIRQRERDFPDETNL